MKVRSVLPRDAIPSIDDPRFAESYPGDEDDDLIVVGGTPTRGYPVRVLSSHEIVNDEVDGEQIAVTWCPICWSAMVFERRVDEQVLTFGTSGKLADDALVMYDRQTESEWKQPTGQAFDGPLTGTRLCHRPAPMRTWGEYRADHPDGVVLVGPRMRGRSRSSSRLDEAYPMEPYNRYAEEGPFGLVGMRDEGDPREWSRSDIDAKTVVVGVELDGEARGYPLPVLEATGGLLQDRVGSETLLVVLGDGHGHVYRAPDFEIQITAEGLEGDGARWDPSTGESDDGRSFDRVPAARMFAFAWQDAHGPDTIVADRHFER